MIWSDEVRILLFSVCCLYLLVSSVACCNCGVDKHPLHEKIGEGKLSTYAYAGGERTSVDTIPYYGFWVLDGRAYSIRYFKWVDVDGVENSFTPSLEVDSYYYIFSDNSGYLHYIHITKVKPNWWDSVK